MNQPLTSNPPTPDDDPRLESLFAEALDLPDPAARAAFLDRACHGDIRLRTRLDALLAAHDRAGGFLQQPAHDLADAPPAVVESPGDTIGPYKLLQRIGEGGFGVVFMAEQQSPIRRRVALKILKPGMDTRRVVARFEAERQALALMDHPHIARVFDAGATPSGRPYFVMELVAGLPLTDYADRNTLDISSRLSLFTQVCRAVQHAHRRGVIHRDLKPTNVLVGTIDGRPVAKVIDFGIAKAVETRLTDQTLFTDFRQMIGTPQYMSPEQAGGGLDIDTRTDVYSLGVLLYELLTGATPFDGRQLAAAALHEVQRILRETDPPRPSTRLKSTGLSPSPFMGEGRGEGQHTDDAPIEATPQTPAKSPSPTLSPSLLAISRARATDPDRLVRRLRGDLDWIVMKALDKDRARRYPSPDDLADDLQRYLTDQPVAAGPPSLVYRARKFLARRRRAVAITTVVAFTAAAWLGGWLTLRADRLRQQAAHSARVADALDRLSQAIGRATAAPIGRPVPWIEARAAGRAVSDGLAAGPISADVAARAQAALRQLAAADADRRFAERIEETVIAGATFNDRDSWQNMESGLRAAFRDYGIDLDQLTPAEAAERMIASTQSVGLADALELWLGAVGELNMMGAAPMTKPRWDAWINVLYQVDPDPIRTGIRRLLYGGVPPARAKIDAVVAGRPLETIAPRTLSWLANLYMMIGARDRCDEIMRAALMAHGDDFMLNSDYVYYLQAQQRWPEAIRYQMRCLALRPDTPGVWRNLGVTLRQTNELDQSREALERAVALRPDHPETHVDLAETLLALGRAADAIAEADRALTLRPNLAAAIALRTRASASRDSAQHESALGDRTTSHPASAPTRPAEPPPVPQSVPRSEPRP